MFILCKFVCSWTHDEAHLGERGYFTRDKKLNSLHFQRTILGWAETCINEKTNCMPNSPNLTAPKTLTVAQDQSDEDQLEHGDRVMVIQGWSQCIYNGNQPWPKPGLNNRLYLTLPSYHFANRKNKGTACSKALTGFHTLVAEIFHSRGVVQVLCTGLRPPPFILSLNFLLSSNKNCF